MCRDTILVHRVHLFGANLELDDLAIFAKNRGVQRAISIRLWLRDVVLDAAFERRPLRVDDPKRRVTVRQRIHDDAYRDEVVNAGDVSFVF